MHRSAFAWLALLCALGSLLLPAGNSYAQVTPPYSENFDSEPTCGTLCGNACSLSTSGWLNDTVSDNYDWTVDAGGTGSGQTGPSGDHTTGSGNYLYTEVSSPCFNAPNIFNLISPPLDLTGATAPFANFWYHMYGQSMGNLHVDVSTDGGASWSTDIIPPITDNIDQWQQTPNINLSAYTGQVILMRLRSEGATNFYGDMAIDDFSLLEQGPNDVGITSVAARAPCGLDTTENLVVEVTNFGTAPQSGFNVEVSANGGASIVEPFPGTIQPFTTVSYTFAGTVDLSGAGPHTLTATTTLAGDGNPFNDSSGGSALNLPTAAPGTTVDGFDGASSLSWSGSGNGNEWQLGSPIDTVINNAYDGTSSWVTDLDNSYSSNANNFLTSGFCYDLTGLSNPAISLAVWWDAETGGDGAVLQASTDGENWSTVGAMGSGNNWYNASGIESTPGGGSDGWSGDTASGSGDWVLASHPLGNLNSSVVMLRIAFSSNSSLVYEGFAMDRVMVYDDVTGVVASSESFVTPGVTSAGAGEVLLQRLALFGSGAGDAVNAVTVNQFGTLADADVPAVRLYLDDGNRQFDPLVDTMLGMQMLAAGQATFNTAGMLNVGPGQAQILFISADISANAMIGETVGFQVAAAGADIVTASMTPTVAANVLDGPLISVGGPVSLLPFLDVFDTQPPNRTFVTGPATFPNATMLGVTTNVTNTNNAAGFEFYSSAGTFNQAPLSGSNYLVLDFPNGEATGALEYAFDLSAYTAANDAISLAFRYGDNADESDVEDYVFISPDGGTTWIAVYNLDPGALTNDTWQDALVDLSGPLQTAGLDYSADFRIRLQGSDNSSLIGGDGLAFDEVLVDFGPTTGVERDSMTVAHAGIDALGQLPAVPQMLSYTITNTGGFVLDFNNSGFFAANEMNVQNVMFTTPPTGQLAGGESTTFQVSFEPGMGAFSFDVAFVVNNDGTLPGNAFNFTVDGEGVDSGPEIDVQRPAMTSIASGMTDAQGDVDDTATPSLTYTIENLGFSELSILSADITNLSNVGAQIIDLPASVLQPGETTEMTVAFSPDAGGPFGFDLQIGSNDSDEGNYTITINGNGIDTTPGTGGGGGTATTGSGGMGGAGGMGVTTGSGGSGGGDDPDIDGGCGCRIATHSDTSLPPWSALSLLALGLILRRRRQGRLNSNLNSVGGV